VLLLGSDVEVAGLTVYRDHASAQTFYYLPRAPRVVVEGDRAGLELIRYRGAESGGFLSLDVDLAVAAETVDSARSELASRAGREVDLLPVLPREGGVRLSVLGVEQEPAGAGAAGGEEAGAGDDPGGPLLVERILASAAPSLYGAARAIFSVELGAEATVLLAEALRSQEMPVLVVYDLAFDGLRPARGLRARVDSATAYDYLRSRFAAGALLFKADLDSEAETLGREGHVQIEDVDYAGSDPTILASREEEVRATLRELAEALFFRPAASPATLGADGIAQSAEVDSAWAKRGRPQAAYVLRDIAQRELQTLTYAFDEAGPATVHVSPQGRLRVPPGFDPSTLVREVTLDDSAAPVEVRALAPPESDWTGVDEIHADFRSGDEVQTVVLSRTATSGSVLLPRGEAGYRVRVLASPEPDALGAPPAADELFLPLPARTLVFDPRVVGGRRVVQISSGAVDWSEVRQVRGTLVVGTRAAGFLLDRDRPLAEIPVWGSEVGRVEGGLVLADGSEVPFGRPVAPEEAVVVVNQPPSLFHVVAVTMQDPLERLDSITVELEGDSGRRRAVLALSAASPTAEWSLPRAADGSAAFRFRTRTLGRDARVSATDWQPGAGSLLVVGDVDVRVVPVEVVLLAPPSSTGALVVLTSLDPPQDVPATAETVVDAGQSTFDARLPFRRDAPLRYRVEGQIFFPDGEVAIGPREETSEVLLIAADS